MVVRDRGGLGQNKREAGKLVRLTVTRRKREEEVKDRDAPVNSCKLRESALVHGTRCEAR